MRENNEITSNECIENKLEIIVICFPLSSFVKSLEIRSHLFCALFGGVRIFKILADVLSKVGAVVQKDGKAKKLAW